MPLPRPRIRLFPLFLAAALVVVASCAGPDGPADQATSGDADYAEKMAREHAGDSPVSNPMSETPADGDIETRMMEYAQVGGEPVLGYLAMPADFDTMLPGVLLIHEWWGLNDNIKAMADRLAGEGYLALAVDLYGGQVASDADSARELMQAATANMGHLKTNLRSAYNFLARTAGTEQIGTLGWCFGGGLSLETALMLPGHVDASVVYYGRLVTDADRLEALDAPLLGLFGAEDEGIPVATVREFEAVLKTLGKDAQIHVYEGADHAFANPSGQRYNAEAAQDAWKRTLAFLDEHLKQ